MWNAHKSRMSERVTGITGGPEGSGPSRERTPKYRADMLDEKQGIEFLEGLHRKRLREWELVEERVD